MRHVTIIATAMLFSLTACRKTDDQDAIRVAAAKSAGQQQQQLQQTQNQQSRDFVGDARISESLKQQYPQEYACTMDLCSDEFKKFPSVKKTVEKAATPTAEQKNYYDTYIVPVLTKNTLLTQKKARAGLDLLNEKERAFPTQELTEQQLFVIHTMYIIKNSAKFPAFDLYWNSILPKEPFYKATMTFRQMGNWTYFTEMHPKVELQQATKDELKFIQAVLEKLNSIIQGAEKIDPLIAAKIGNGELITTEEAKSLSSMGFAIRMMDHFLFGGGRHIITQLMEQHTLSKTELYKIYEDSGIKTTMALQANAMTATTCEAQYYQSINLYPQPQELERFKQLAETTRQAAIESLGPMQTEAAKYLSQAKFNYPLSAAENSKAWLRALEMKNKTHQDEIDGLKDLDIQSLYAMFLVRSIFNSPDSAKPDQCPQIPDADISDKTNTSTGHVLVSWYSIRHPEMGAGILAHELGHGVQAHSVPSSIQSTNQCLARKQSSEQYISEDFADVFAAKVMMNLKNNHKVQTANYACGLMDSLQSLRNLNTKSVHSSDLYRALQLKVESKEKVPQSCEQLAQSNQASITHSCQ
ncbi:hypothetical protein [Bdellovibrio sp. HCB274]|uniref:hypothetical protein n=1 Tax=Bdellovibrio sp. HCB274 TaxID=3394361 RepID=UPI0039B42FF7